MIKPAGHDAPSALVQQVTTWMCAVAIIGIAWLAYRHGLHGPFIFDDLPAITENPHIRSVWPLSQSLRAPPQTAVTGRPVASLTLAINHAFGQYEVRGYHLFNLAAHVLTGLALFGALRQILLRFAAPPIRMLHATIVSAVAASIWVAHPLASDTVLYVSNRTELLMGLFFLLTAYFSTRALNPRWAWLWGACSIVCCGLGMLSKESMAAAPIVVFLLDWVLIRRPLREWVRQRGWIYAGLSLTWIPLALVVASGARSASVGFNLGMHWWEYLFTQAGVILTYLKLSLWPHPLSIVHDTQAVAAFKDAAAPGAVVLFLLVLTVYAIVRRHWLGLIGAAFFLVLAPSSSVIPLVTELSSERRMYVPLMAIVVMIVIGADRLGSFLQRSLGVPSLVWHAACVAVTAITLLCAIQATDRRSHVFSSELSIWQDAAAKAPLNYTAQNNLGEALRNEGRLNEAIECYRRASALQPELPDPLSNLGIACVGLRRFREAEASMRAAIKVAPEDPGSLNNLAYLLATCPDASVRNGLEAVEHALHACRIAGAVPAYMDTLATALAEAGRFDEAVATAERARDLALADGNKAMAADIASRLPRFRAREPYHEP